MKERLQRKELYFTYSLQQIAKEYIIENDDSPEVIKRKKSFGFGLVCGPFSQGDFESFAECIRKENVDNGRNYPEMILQANLEGGEHLSILRNAGLTEEGMRWKVYRFLDGWSNTAKENNAEKIIFSRKHHNGMFVLSNKAVEAWQSLAKKVAQRSQSSSANKK